MQYVIEISSNSICQVSQGSVETYLKGETENYVCTKFPQESDSKRIV